MNPPRKDALRDAEGSIRAQIQGAASRSLAAATDSGSMGHADWPMPTPTSGPKAANWSSSPPTLKAAQAAAELGAPAHSAAALIHEYGFGWDQDGRWTRDAVRPQSVPLGPGDVLLGSRSWVDVVHRARRVHRTVRLRGPMSPKLSTAGWTESFTFDPRVRCNEAQPDRVREPLPGHQTRTS